jgi:E3 ubiquitin-protein ligase SHPRH
MGLGKTLETLMLILANPAPPGWAVADLAKYSRAVEEEPVPIKSTLIIMPANLLGQWQDELETHVAEGALTW